MGNARDIETSLTLADKTGMGLASAERRLKQHSDKVKQESDRMSSTFAKGVMQMAEAISPRLAASLTNAFSAAGTSAGPLLVTGIAAAAPLVGATISAAVIGGVGIGGVVGGVALAARDPRVQAAGKSLGKNLLQDLESDASVFVDPILKNVGKVETRFEQMNGRIKNIFKNSSGFLDPLVDGALDGIDGILTGVDKLIGRAGPVMSAVGRSFGTLGDSVGDALDTISGGSEDAADALDDVTWATAAAIQSTAGLVRTLTELYGAIKYVSPLGEAATKWLGKLVGVEEDAGESADTAAPSTNRFASSISGVSDAAADATPNLQRIADATRAVYDANNDLYSSETDVAQAVADATKKIGENGRTLSINSEKGRENRGTLSSIAGALQKNYDAYVKVNGVGPRSAAVADTLRNKFIALAQKAGASAAEARHLADELLHIPSSRNTKVTVQAEKALNEAREIRRAINSIPLSRVTTILVQGRLDKVAQQLSRTHGGSFDATSTFAKSGPDAGVSRTGGATPAVNVANNLTVSLDGAPFRQYTAQAIDANDRRQAWRAKVGKR